MRWTLKLVAEVARGTVTKYEVAAFERDERITPVTLGLRLAEAKAVLAATQARVVVRQAQSTIGCPEVGSVHGFGAVRHLCAGSGPTGGGPSGPAQGR